MRITPQQPIPQTEDGRKLLISNYGRRHDDTPRAIRLLRECGRWLHHGNGDPAELVAPLTRRELQTLERLLEKCLNGDGFQV